MAFRRSARIASAVAVTALLSACLPASSIYAGGAAVAYPPPPPGYPSYFQTIKYIDDGMQYVDRRTAFFVRPDGGMCFRGAVDTQNQYTFYYTDWCIPADSVREVTDLGHDTLRLYCKHSTPRCAWEIAYWPVIGNTIAYYGGTANTITIRITPPDQEKAALEHLVHLLGSSLGDAQPFAADRTLRR